MASYMITLRHQDDDATLDKPRYLSFADTNAPEVQATDPLAWRNHILAEFPPGSARDPHGRPNRTGDLLFFVHGFNVNFASAKASHFHFQDSLKRAGWNGVLVSYDWPSQGMVFSYLPDRDNARLAASALVSSGISLLEDTQQTDCRINVHVMAHSMGCFVVQQAFNWAYQDVPADWSIAQLVMAAADVDYTVFSADNLSAKNFGKHAGRLTAYCNRYDKALTVSDAKRLEMTARMGRVGLPVDAPPMMCEVDCSALFDVAYPGVASHLDPGLSHGFYFQRDEFWQDVVLTLGGGMDRAMLPTRPAALTGTLPNRYGLETQPLDAATYARALAQAANSPSIQIPPAP